MMAIYGPLQLILSVVYFMMIIHIIMSWLINFQVLNLHQPLVAQIWIGLNKLLEPIYQPIRRILPDTRPMDLAPLVAFLSGARLASPPSRTSRSRRLASADERPSLYVLLKWRMPWINSWGEMMHLPSASR